MNGNAPAVVSVRAHEVVKHGRSRVLFADDAKTAAANSARVRLHLTGRNAIAAPEGHS